MEHAEQGYLTIAVGKPRYLEMAVDLVLSMRERDSRPFALAADAGLATDARERFPGIFSSIHVIDPRYLHHRALKFCAAEVAPFEETVYIDADCLVVADPESLWTGAGAGPVTMTGEMLYREGSRDRWHQGFHTRALMERFGLEAYLKTNGGIVHFRRAGAAELFEECHRCYNDVVLGQLWDGTTPKKGLGDEFAYGIVGGRHGFDTYPDPVPTHWAKEIMQLDLREIRKPIVHFIAPPPRAALDGLMKEVYRRRKAAGLSPEASIPEWREEASGPGLAQLVKRRIYRRIRRWLPSGR